VVDVSEPIEEIREKLITSHDTLYERNEAPIVTVLNKIDAVSDDELAEKTEALSALAPNPIAVSGKEQLNLRGLRKRVDDELPDWKREKLVLPMTEDTMSVVSWVHDHARVNDVTYAADEVVVDFEARPEIVEQSRAKAGDLTSAPSA
jgi:GTP-binding protein HflX